MGYIPLHKVYYANKEKYEEEYSKRYSSVGSVHLNFKVYGYDAFFCVTDEAAGLLYAIQQNDKKVNGICMQLPGVARTQYANRCLIDEVVGTNKIEGVHSSRKEIGSVLSRLEAQSLGRNKQSRFWGMVERYMKLRDSDIIPLKTCEDVRALYDEIALPEVIAEDKKNEPDGAIFRKDATFIYGDDGNKLHSGAYPEWRVIEATKSALDFLNSKETNPLFRMCIFHYMLEYIHPFYDGNGRLGRFILSYGISREMNPLLAYGLSETIHKNKNAYYKAFEESNNKTNKGDLTPFLIVMLKIILESSENLAEKLEEKKELLKETTEKVTEKIPEAYKTQLKDLYILLVQAALFSSKGITSKEIEIYVKKKRSSVSNMLKKISENGLLITEKAGNTNYYKLDLNKLEEME